MGAEAPAPTAAGAPSATPWTTRVWLCLGLAAVLAMVWREVCLFPLHGWNEVRLAPVFQWVLSGTPYPSPEQGPSTTWIYGPLPLVLMSPVALASSAAGALLGAAGLNAAFTIAALVAVATGWRVSGSALRPVERAAVALACLGLWPGGAFRFFVADGPGLACALVSLTLLVRARPGGTLAAAGWCAAAVLCKQTFAGVAVAQLAWLALREGAPAARRHAIAVAGFCALGLGAAAALWGARNVGYHLFALPALQPWADAPGERILAFWPAVAISLLVPAVLVVATWRRIVPPASPWLLPLLVWACALPLDLAAFLKTGGGANSLHGAAFLLPVAVLLATARLPARFRVSLPVGAAVLGAVASLALDGPGVWRPQTAHLQQGRELVRALPGQVYFPWHPLITFFAERRIDEVEDGLFIRQLAGQPVARPAARLPPDFNVIAFRRGEPDWGIARTLLPPHAPTQPYGAWEIHALRRRP